MDVRRIVFRSKREALLARNSGWSERIWWMVFVLLVEDPGPTLPVEAQTPLEAQTPQEAQAPGPTGARCSQ